MERHVILSSQYKKGNMKKIIVYVDMDDVVADFSGAHAKALKRNPKNQFPQSEYGFFANLELIPHAKGCLDCIINHPNFDVYFLTAPSVMNPLCYTEKRMWVEKHFGMKMVKKMIITPNKGLNKGDYLIDDNISGKGQENFEGELIHFGSDNFKHWIEVLGFFTELM